MATYKKKYVNVEAIKWWALASLDSDSYLNELYSLGKFVYGFNGDENPKIEYGLKEIGPKGPILWLKNCNGMREVHPGDFVIKTPNGCVYPLCPESFHMSYEAVE